jgi:hypothetical protein
MRTKPNSRNYLGNRNPMHCYRCGAKSRSSPECRFKNENCRKCGNRGHIQRVCRSTKTESRRKQNYFCEEDDDSFVASVNISKATKSNSGIIWVTTKIDGQALKMELDTGSAVSIIPLEKYKRMLRHIPIEKAEVSFKTYSGEEMSPEGVLESNTTTRPRPYRCL